MVNASLTRDNWTQSSAKCVLSLGMLCLCLAYGFWKNCKEDACTKLGCSSELSVSPSGCSPSYAGCLFQPLSFSPHILMYFDNIIFVLVYLYPPHLLFHLPRSELTLHRTNRTTSTGKAAAYIWMRKGPWDGRATIWKCFILPLFGLLRWWACSNKSVT